MFTLLNIVNEIEYEHRELMSVFYDKSVMFSDTSDMTFTIENLLKTQIIPSFQRDYPNIKAASISNYTSNRFYPHKLPDGDKFLNHIYLIKQDRAMQSYLTAQITPIPPGEGDIDGFVSIITNDVVKKLVRLSFQNSSFVNSPIILFDDATEFAYYYQLDGYSNYVLIYTVYNNVTFDSTYHATMDDVMIAPNYYEPLKAYITQKLSEYVVGILDMKSKGVLDEYISKILDGLRNADSTKLFDPTISSLSLGGELSIGFNTQSTVLQSAQSAVPNITRGYQDLQKSIRKASARNYKKFKTYVQRNFM